MRIVFVALANAPSLQRYAAFAANELAQRHEVHVVTTHHAERSHFAPLVHHHPLGTTRTPRLELQTANLFAAHAIVKLIKRLRPDIVHYTCAHPWNLLIARLTRRYRQVFTIHDVVPHPGESVTRVVAWYNRSVFRGLADRVIVHGKAHLKVLGEQGIDLSRFVDVPLGEVLPPARQEPVPRAKRVLFSGRIVPYKGLEVLLAAAPAVLEAHPDAVFVIAGSGDLTRYRPLFGKLPLEIHNRFIPEAEMAGFFYNARLVVLPYTSATQSGVIPLAYAFRRPVVATAVGALPEMVCDGETGLLVPPGQPAALARAIVQLLDDWPRCCRMGEAGYELFLARYTPHVMAQGFEAVYKEMAGEGHSRARRLMS